MPKTKLRRAPLLQHFGENRVLQVLRDTRFMQRFEQASVGNESKSQLCKEVMRELGGSDGDWNWFFNFWHNNHGRIQDKLARLKLPPESCTEADNVESSPQNQQQETTDNENSKPTAQVTVRISKRLHKGNNSSNIKAASQVVTKIKKTQAKKRKHETNSTCHGMVESMTYSQENGDSDDVVPSDWFIMLYSAVENLNSSYTNQKIENGYIQETTLQPFKVISFDENRMGIAIDVLKMAAGTTLHVGTALDVVKPLPQNQDVSLSVALFRGKDSHHHPLVLSDMLSEKRDASTYQHWLTLLDDALEKVSSGASIKRTESNYNLELLSALTMAFNKMSLPLYLQICHNALSDDGGGVDESQKKSSSTEDLNEFLKSALHICSFHTIYLFNKFFSQLDISPETIKFYLFAMGCMITSDSYAMTKDIFRDVCTIALNDKKTAKVNESFLHFFESFLEDRNEMDNLIKRVQSYENQMEDVRDQPGYSPFTADFMAIAEEVNREISSSEDDEVNTRFCPDFLTYFMQYWSSITPLWTANILRIVVSEKIVTNESTRDFFSTIKMQGERRWSYDKFLTTMSAQYKDMSEDYVENLPLVVHNGNEAEITSANS